MIFYVYILQSKKDGNFYTGYTADIKKRINEHNNGKVKSTSYRRPLYLVYYEVCSNQQDALHREKYLKTSWGKRYIKSRLKNYLTGLGEASTAEIARKTDTQGFNENKIAAKKGGNIAGGARKKLEVELGRDIVSKDNYLDIKKRKKIERK